MSLLIRNGEPLYKIGIIADIQYANVDNQYNFAKTRLRYYRKSLDLLRRAVSKWLEEQVDCVLQLGDIIDGLNKRQNESEKALTSVCSTFQKLPCPIYHTIGNHELYNFTKAQLLKTELFCGNRSECSGPSEKFYFSSKLHKKLRLIVLDCYDVSALSIPKNSKKYEEITAFLRKHNPNTSLNSWEGMQGTDKRFVEFNGALSDQQLEWLEDNLKESLENQENVIVMGHVGSNPAAKNRETLLWNCFEVQDLLQKYSSCVLCYLAGHNHEGENNLDDFGIHHITLPAVVESNDEDAFGTAYLYNENLVIHGEGTVPSLNIKLRFPVTS